MHPYNERLKAQADKRRAKFAKLKKAGYTLQEIGDMNNITRERVRQILGAGK